jgi:hypothetical protein
MTLVRCVKIRSPQWFDAVSDADANAHSDRLNSRAILCLSLVDKSFDVGKTARAFLANGQFASIWSRTYSSDFMMC